MFKQVFIQTKIQIVKYSKIRLGSILNLNPDAAGPKFVRTWFQPHGIRENVCVCVQLSALL